MTNKKLRDHYKHLKLLQIFKYLVNPVIEITTKGGSLTLRFRDGTYERYPAAQAQSLLKVKNYFLKEISFEHRAGNKLIYIFPWSPAFRASSAIKSYQTHVARFIEMRVLELLNETQEKLYSTYPRDSSVARLHGPLSKLEQEYQANNHLYEQFLSKGVIGFLSELCKILPLELNAAALRKRYEENRLAESKRFFDTVESNPLTSEQRLAVLRNNDLNLVLAAAGTGKTSVIVAKALDLILNQRVLPSEILILAYNRAASNEIKERTFKRAASAGFELAAPPQISTFHALGRQILLDSKISVRISRFAEDQKLLSGWIHQWLREFIASSPTALGQFLESRYKPVNPMEFETAADYEKYVRDNEYRALNGHLVRGYQELLIANWLFLNGVDFEYEPSYVSKRRIEIGFDYKPDFHILGTSIYLEHFGVDREGATRADIDRVAYNESMQKKRELHAQCGTTLLETYHYDWTEGKLLERLASLLKANKIPLTPLPTEMVLKSLNDVGLVEDGSRVLQKALSAIRIEELQDKDIKQRLEEKGLVNSQAHYEILSKLVVDYRQALRDEESIDFDDMILRAIECVKEGKYKPKWKFILVDEFQDISGSRMSFLKTLISRGPTPSMTAVGDDWQAIYRFAGGKLELTTRFEELVGRHTLTKLQKTFRYNNSIADTAGTFIMQNEEQYKKSISTHSQVDSPTIHLLDSGSTSSADAMAKRALFLVEQLKDKKPGHSIAILARYRYLLEKCRNELEANNISDVKLWTFHSSKGLEADHCILTGFEMGKTGFPNENDEDEVVEALLPSLDTFPHSEERRLMYVALTRAKYSVCIVANPQAPSSFINELLTPKYSIQVHSESFQAKMRAIYKCPQCIDGYLMSKSGQYGLFYKCSSGSACRVQARVCKVCGGPTVDYAANSICKNLDCGDVIKICPKCGRPMKLLDGSYGQFYGCSGFGFSNDQCKHTEKLH